jgi:hypothetical protein
MRSSDICVWLRWLHFILHDLYFYRAEELWYLAVCINIECYWMARAQVDFLWYIHPQKILSAFIYFEWEKKRWKTLWQSCQVSLKRRVYPFTRRRTAAAAFVYYIHKIDSRTYTSAVLGVYSNVNTIQYIQQQSTAGWPICATVSKGVC